MLKYLPHQQDLSQNPDSPILAYKGGGDYLNHTALKLEKH